MLAVSAGAGTIHFTGQVIRDEHPIAASKVVLSPFDDQLSRMEATLQSDGSFSFSFSVDAPAYYELTFAGYSKNILFSPQESDPGFRVLMRDGHPDKMYILNSYENMAHELLRDQLFLLRDTLNGFRNSCLNDPVKCKRYWQSVVEDYSLHVRQIASDFPSTITGSTLARMADLPMIPEGTDPVNWLNRHFFDGCDFSDKRIFSTPDFGTKVIAYVQHIGDSTPEGRTRFINDLFMRTKGDMEANRKLSLALYNIFEKKQWDDYSYSLGQWLETRPWASEQVPVILAGLRLAAKLSPGSIAPEIKAPNEKGRMESLSAHLKGAKVCMVLFWSSECSHCVESMPEISKLYDGYKSRGLVIFGASLDNNAAAWKSYLQTQKLDWTNVLMGPGHPALNEYLIQATPSMVLISENGRVIDRFLDIRELTVQLKKIFNE